MGSAPSALVELVRAGRFSEAEAAARVRVAAEPGDAAALSLLARLCLQNGRVPDAVVFAERLASLVPSDPQALVLAGRALRTAGRDAEAVGRYQAATRIAPRAAEGWIGLGLALRASDPAAACDALERACELEPANAQARLNLANALVDTGDLDRAEALLREVLAADPAGEDVLLRLGALLTRRGRESDASVCFRRILQANPLHAEAAARLAVLEAAAGRFETAASLAGDAVRLAPRDAACLALAGDALRVSGSLDEAIDAYRQCLQADPDHVLVLNNLANVLCNAGRLTEAAGLAQRALDLAPRFADAAATLGRAVALGGRPREAQAILDSATAQPGVSLQVIQAALMNLNAVDGLGLRAVVARHREEIARVAFPPAAAPGWAGSTGGGRLRVGYLSPDFRLHSVAYFVEALLRNHDREAVEVVCYSLSPYPDEVTHRLRGLSERWVHCASLNDDALAGRIRADGIQILVDLAGHTAGGRLGVFARRAAPVQCTWLGYPTVTGVPAMDWRITDPVVDPPDQPWAGPEQPLRLAPSYFCYTPPAGAPQPSAEPGRSDGYTVFASFNNLSKLSELTLGLWSSVLAAVPRSRLLVKAKGIGDAATNDGLMARLEAAGVPADRVLLRGFEVSSEHHLAAFDKADVILDASPYNGATTTCEALWMGVPVVTLAGGTHAGRMGASILGAAGLDEWVAQDAQGYVRIAAALAAAGATPGARRRLRERVAASALVDGRGFAAAMEAAYRQAWAAFAGVGAPAAPGSVAR